MLSGCSDDCETDGWWLGAKGNCSVLTNGSSVNGSSSMYAVCMCPEGYSGEDDWGSWGDCHVPVHVQSFVCHAIIALGFVQMALLTYAILHTVGMVSSPRAIHSKLRGKVGNLKEKSSRVLSSQSISSSGSDSGSSSADKPVAKRGPRGDGMSGSCCSRFGKIWNDKKLGHKRMLLSLYAMYVLFAVGGTIYETYISLGEFRSRPNGVRDFALATAATFVVGGLWLVTLMWFKTLPVNLLPKTSWLRRFPSGVRCV